MVEVSKDKKGKAYIVTHKRAGFHECIWLTMDELKELHEAIEKVFDGND